MSETGRILPSGTRVTYVDPTPPLVPDNVGPGPDGQDRHAPLDMGLLDEVDEGVQRLNVAVPLTPKSRRLKELEDMVKETTARHRADVLEAQEIIDRANEETRAMRRERDGARNAAPQQAPLSALPEPFEFGGFRTNPRSVCFLSCSSSSFILLLLFLPPLDLGPLVRQEEERSEGGTCWTPPSFRLKGSLLSHIELSREVRMSREAKEESEEGHRPQGAMANKRVDAELIDLQTTFLQVQAQLDEYFGARGDPRGDPGRPSTPVSGSSRRAEGVYGSKRVTVQPSPPSSEVILYYRVKSKSAFAR